MTMLEDSMDKGPYREDYAHHWRMMNVKGKTVLDLGCDWGSTAKYFLAFGAKHVVGVDGDESYMKRAANAGIPNFTFVLMQIKTTEDFNNLLIDYSPDIVKVDVEGAEELLSNLSVEALFIPSEWHIETHGDQIFNLLVETVVKRLPDYEFTTYIYLGSFKMIVLKRSLKHCIEERRSLE